MWKDMVEPAKPQMTIQCMHFACQITKANIQPHTENV